LDIPKKTPNDCEVNYQNLPELQELSISKWCPHEHHEAGGPAGQSLDSMDLKTAGCIELAELQNALKKSLGDTIRLCGEISSVPRREPFRL